ncbi:CGNR zinc finger domain-containing protein [Alkalihalobacillus sp. CinArs1]|uniref:CGNR zinc finger domain-containing protein n=1 Tax=Alkalihalobacillus sp. CinArs1 TaxID=2995314 RepID=UPI0022DD0E1E|nr:CGNR zinc finger domain-containing protein [Alkalihalobacillus sp. CinArs1]
MNQQTNFPHFSDHLFINLMNTMKMHESSPTDLLATASDGLEWIELMREKGLLTTRQVERINEGPLHMNDLRNFRDQCRAYFAEEDENVIGVLSTMTETAPLSFIIEDGSLTPLPSQGGTNGLLSIIALSMLELQESGTLTKVKACENDECLAFFVNQKGKRKWCSMEVCGNRTKAKKHYQKTKMSQNKG